jgi:signal peptidase I
MSRPTFQDPSIDLRWLRSAFDISVCFVLTVIMLRSFVLEGYLISTGSMAPGLLGFHRRITCPECQFDFAFGVSFDDSVSNVPALITDPTGSQRYATCPNCGRNQIDVVAVPNSHGDQLLVQKHVYDLRPPKRWETVVFRNPASPGEAYVKRVVGLPGEQIQVINGNVWINGEISRKNFDQQSAMRIPVSSLRNVANSDDWELPWELDESWTAENGTLRCQSNSETASDATADPITDSSVIVPNSDADQIRWIRFRHWRWFGGNHCTETPLPLADAIDWDSYAAALDDVPITRSGLMDYDRDREVLRCKGVMSTVLQNDLLRHATTEGFRRAVFRLAALSHLAPVTDRYGYNALVSSPEYVVSDLMFSTEISWSAGAEPQTIHVRIPCGSETFGLVLRFASGTMELVSLDQKQLVASGEIPESLRGGMASRFRLDVSNIDRQIIVAIDGKPCLPEVLCAVGAREEALEATVTDLGARGIDATRAAELAVFMEQQNRWAIGVSGGDVRLDRLDMFRDVFYTPGKRRNAIESEYSIPPESYFVQGDNSPVSSDSRNWNQASVPHRMLLGKPFLVHLPSRPAILQLGERRWPIRVPDWSRIRYIH